MKKLDKIIETFISFCNASQLADRTIFDYKLHLRGLSKFLPEERPDDLRSAALAYLGAKHINANTYNIRFACLSRFFKWAADEGLISGEYPLRGLKKRKPVSRVVNIDTETLKKLLELTDQGTYVGVRDYALLLLSCDTGIRPNEALSLVEEDIDFNSLLVTVRAAVAKTRQSRVLPISIQTAKAIKKLLQCHGRDWAGSPVFASYEGSSTPLTVGTWSHRVSAYGKRIGIKISPYHLRHCFALNFLRKSGNIFALQKIMGHQTLSMTQRYLAQTLDDIKREHSAASLLNEIVPVKQRICKVA